MSKPVVNIFAHLSQPRWSVRELLSAPLRGTAPTYAKAARTAQLAGLSVTPTIESDLVNQLRFVETLAAVQTDNVEPLARFVAPVECVEFENMVEPAEEPEQWNPTALASERSGNFYVVKEGLSG